MPQHGGDLIADVLARHGVTHLFTLCNGMAVTLSGDPAQRAAALALLMALPQVIMHSISAILAAE